MQVLLEQPSYNRCLQKISDRYRVREGGISDCSKTIYHELSKDAHWHTRRNMDELFLDDKENTLIEVAAIESIFCALKDERCFHIPMKIYVE